MKFKEFKSLKENETDKKIKTVRSDNGTEFCNQKFQNFFTQEGIKHERTVAYSPSSNGTAERANRTLLDTARTMLIDAELPVRFWAEAIKTAAHVRNHAPTKSGGIKTPMEQWTRKIPSVIYFKIFGCIAYYFVAKEKRTKFDAKANKGIFVGYSEHRKAYRIYDPLDDRVHEVRTVKFDETVKGAHLLHRNYNRCTENDLIYSRSEESKTLEESQSSTEIDIILKENCEEIPKPGRKKGDTAEVLKQRHQAEILEREKRLLEQGVRRSERLKEREKVNVVTEVKHIPTSYDEAVKSQYSENWKTSMEEEIQSLQLHKVWKLVPRTKHMKVIKSKWIFNVKENADGFINKRKARLVAMGYNQRKGIDYEESFAPVMKLEALRLLIALSAKLNLKVHQYDIKAAYLHGELKEKVYMEQPEGFAENGRHLVCELQKSIYGLPQSGRCWNVKFNDILRSLGFQQLESDPCLYKYQVKDRYIFMGIYVDDLLVAGTDEEIVKKVMDEVSLKLEITKSSDLNLFLGFQIREKAEGFYISQQNYIAKLLEKYKLNECNSVKSPGVLNQDLDNWQDSKSVDQKLYQEMIGSLMCLSVGTRPDISYNVSLLSQYSKNPKQIHLSAIKRIFRYLKGTINLKLFYDRECGKLNASADASWCSTKDAKSFSGYSIKLGNSLVHWKSRKQNLVALSTCEAELISLCESVRDIKWIYSILSELSAKQFIDLPINLNSDSKSAIELIRKGGPENRTKHINRKYFFIRDEVMRGNLKITFVKSEDMEADVLTKNLVGHKLFDCIRKMYLCETRKQHLQSRGDC